MSTTKKTTTADQVKAAMAKVEAAKAAETKTEVKEEVKKAPAAKKAPAKKAEPVKKEAPAAKKAAAKKTAATKATETVVLQWQGKDLDTKSIVDRAVAAAGKKSIKELNVYVQPENNKVYFTADDVKGEFDI